MDAQAASGSPNCHTTASNNSSEHYTKNSASYDNPQNYEPTKGPYKDSLGRWILDGPATDHCPAASEAGTSKSHEKKVAKEIPEEEFGRDDEGWEVNQKKLWTSTRSRGIRKRSPS